MNGRKKVRIRKSACRQEHVVAANCCRGPRVPEFKFNVCAVCQKWAICWVGTVFQSDKKQRNSLYTNEGRLPGESSRLLTQLTQRKASVYAARDHNACVGWCRTETAALRICANIANILAGFRCPPVRSWMVLALFSMYRGGGDYRIACANLGANCGH